MNWKLLTLIIHGTEVLLYTEKYMPLCMSPICVKYGLLWIINVFISVVDSMILCFSFG